MPDPAYGWEHQQRAAALKRKAVGTICPLCGELMLGSQWRAGALHLDHTNPADKAAGLPGDRVTHAFCNQSRGNGTRNPSGKIEIPSSRDW